MFKIVVHVGKVINFFQILVLINLDLNFIVAFLASPIRLYRCVLRLYHFGNRPIQLPAPAQRLALPAPPQLLRCWDPLNRFHFRFRRIWLQFNRFRFQLRLRLNCFGSFRQRLSDYCLRPMSLRPMSLQFLY